MKRVLITGSDSYIGTSVQNWLNQTPEDFSVDVIDMRDGSWAEKSFAPYDAVFHVAGIAHVSTDPKLKDLYFKINRDLAVQTAQKAKSDGVGQFVFMSSIIVYGDSGKNRIIDSFTQPTPTNFYGDSKLQAEQGILPLADQNFRVVVLRPPMIYGKGCKGNYPKLAKLAQRLPFFPAYPNKRSMLHIDNLCEFIKQMIIHGENGIFFPQNAEHVNTAELVGLIAKAHGKRMRFTTLFNPFISFLRPKIGLLNKVFGDLTYEQSISTYQPDYRVHTLAQSIEQTEN